MWVIPVSDIWALRLSAIRLQPGSNAKSSDFSPLYPRRSTYFSNCSEVMSRAAQPEKREQTTQHPIGDASRSASSHGLLRVFHRGEQPHLES